jgi:hypothetical protein
VDLVNREPVEILRTQYNFIAFISNGKIDPDELQRQMRLGVEMVPLGTTENKSPQLVDAELGLTIGLNI